jgi:hypothetical protein
MTKEKLKEKYFQRLGVTHEKQKRIAKALLIGGLIVGGLYFSRYLLDGFAETVRGFKNVRRAFKE